MNGLNDAVLYQFNILFFSFRCDKRKWLVYIASCLVSMLDFGLALTFGSIFVLLLDTFGENRTSTAAVQSILLGTTTMASKHLLLHLGKTWLMEGQKC